VIVSFMDGNPDRPVIIGMLPNVNTMPAWSLPASKTQSGIMSRSSPGGGPDNANALRFEDKAGAEQLWMQAERNMDTVVKNDETKSVGSNRSVQVGGHHSVTVGRNQTVNVSGDHTEGISGNNTLTVGGELIETVKRNMTLNVTEGRQDSTIKGDITVTSQDGEITVTSPKKITLVVGGSSITMTPNDITIVGGKIFLNP
jgi:type VI secretion system secreted protein VgrG